MLTISLVVTCIEIGCFALLGLGVTKGVLWYTSAEVTDQDGSSSEVQAIAQDGSSSEDTINA